VADHDCDPYGCSACATVVFIPRGAGVTGGVCTQQARGCRGEITKLGAVRAETVRSVIAARGVVEQPWLTLIFAPTRDGKEVRRG